MKSEKSVTRAPADASGPWIELLVSCDLLLHYFPRFVRTKGHQAEDDSVFWVLGDERHVER